MKRLRGHAGKSASGAATTERTAYRSCGLCEANCGLSFTFRGDRLTAVRPDGLDVFSRGHICPKGVSYIDLQDDPDRLKRPVQRTASGWKDISWADAATDVAANLSRIIAEYGPDAVAFYSGNPSAHAFDFALHGAALKRAVGTRNLYSANSVDANPHLLVSLKMFGHHLLLPVPDLDRTKTFLVIGANPVVSNGSLMGAPGFSRRIADLKARGGQLIVIDPRRTESAKIADKHIFVKPGTDAALLAALLLVLKRRRAVHPGAVGPLLEGWTDAWRALETFSLDALLEFCGVGHDDVVDLAARLRNGPSVAYGRMGISIQPFATLSVWLTVLLNIALGSFDQPGGAMFAEPALDAPAAGTRPASHARYRSRVSGYAEFMGEFPVAALAEEMLAPGPGKIRALVTFAGNPVLSTPNGRHLEHALASLDYIAAFDVHVNETTRFAHCILPSPRPLAVPNYDISLNTSIRNVARIQPALVPLNDDEQHDWVTLNSVRRKLCANLGLAYAELEAPMSILDQRLRSGPHQLSVDTLQRHIHGIDLGALRPCIAGRLLTPDGRIACAPPQFLADLERLRADVATASPPGLRIIGRREVRGNNSWMHNVPRLAAGKDRCVLLVHPEDLAKRQIDDGEMVDVRGSAGTISVIAKASDDMMPGVVCMPHGWGHHRPATRLNIAAQAPGASLNDIIEHRRIDPVSGNSAPNGSVVELRKSISPAPAEKPARSSSREHTT